MFCSKCGTRLDDTANFCSECGNRIQHNTAQSSHNAQPKNNYTMYEAFDATDDTATKIGGFFNRILSSPDDPITLTKFVLTDRSIITDQGEYSYQQMTVIAPSSSFIYNLLGGGYTFGYIRTFINGKEYSLKFGRQNILRFSLAAILANEKIQLSSTKQKLQCANMMYAYLLHANDKIRKLPVTYEGLERVKTTENDASAQYQNTTAERESTSFVPPAEGKEPYSEFVQCNYQVTVNPGAQLTMEEQQLIENYGYVQRLLNEFFKKHNPISNAGQNRSPFILGDIINFMTDEDTNASAAIAKYNEEVRRKLENERRANLEYQRAQERKAEYDDGKEDYYWSSDCMQRKNFRHGNYKIIRKCEGCRLAPYCSSYR